MFPKAQALSIFIPEWLASSVPGLEEMATPNEECKFHAAPGSRRDSDTGTAQFPLSSPEKHSGGSQSGEKLVEDKRHLKRIKEGAHSLIKLELHYSRRKHYSWDWRDDLAVENSFSEFSWSVPNIHVRWLAPGCVMLASKDLIFSSGLLRYMGIA